MAKNLTQLTQAVMAARPRAADSAAFFKVRQYPANWLIDTQGLWSYPAFVKSETGRLDRLFIILPSLPLPAKKITALFRPKAVVITKGDSASVIKYENFRFGHDPFAAIGWDKPLAMYPHRAVAKLTRSELAARETALLESYAESEATFAKSGEVEATFATDFVNLVHPVFLPYLRYLARPFFNALGIEQQSRSKA